MCAFWKARTDFRSDSWFVQEILPHEAALTRYLARVWPDRSEIEDIRHDAYVRILESAHRLQIGKLVCAGDTAPRGRTNAVSSEGLAGPFGNRGHSPRRLCAHSGKRAPTSTHRSQVSVFFNCAQSYSREMPGGFLAAAH